MKFVAHVSKNRVAVYYLDGELDLQDMEVGISCSYCKIGVKGELFQIINLGTSLLRGLKVEVLEKKTVDKCVKALEDGTLTFEVDEKEKKRTTLRLGRK